MTSSISRRDFFTYSGSVLAGITLGEWGRRHLARADALATVPSRVPSQWAPSVCRDCAAACGIRVRLSSGVPLKIEGNPLCPIGRGRLCAAGQAAIEAYYDPDRLIGPATRAGRRGENRWTAITWDEATTILASRLRQPHTPETRPLAVGTEERGPLADGWSRFWGACDGAVAWTPSATSARLRAPFLALTGVDREPVFDIEHATYVLSFGAPIAENWMSPVWAQRSFGRFRRQPGRSRGRLVQLDVRRSATSRKADEWLALTPEQQVVLAYGIAAVIARENRGDRAFLERFAGNHADFERDVVRTYLPDEVSALTGVPVVTVLRLARELSATEQPLVAVAADASRDLVDAAFALNALVGAFDRPGGIYAAAAPALEGIDDAAVPLQAIAAGRIQPSVFALRDGAALRGTALTGRSDASAAAGFVVSFSPYLDEASAIADLLLPSHTPMESWHAVRAATAPPGEAIAFAAPAVAPRLDTRDPVETLVQVARTLGGEVAANCSWTTAEDLVSRDLERIGQMRRGGAYTNSYETEWLLQLERAGWWTSSSQTPQAFRAAVLEAGGWVDPFFQDGDIRSALEARHGLTFTSPGAAPAVAAAALHPTASGIEPASGSTEATGQFPFRLMVFGTSAGRATDPNLPALYELVGQPEGVPWQPWVEIAEEPARALGIQNGVQVNVISAAGRMTAVAMIVQGMQPDVVALAHVPSLAGGGRWAREIHSDSRQLLPGGGNAGAVRVRLERLQGFYG